VTVAVLIPLTYRNLVLRFHLPLFRQLLRFGLPYIPAGLAGIAIQVIDRPILKALTDDATVGIYQANYRLGIIMMLCVSMFDYAWRPFFLTQAKEEHARELFARIFTYFMGALLFVFIAVSLLVHDLVRVELFGAYFFNPAYWDGVMIVPWILLAYVFTGAYVNFVVGVNIEKKTQYLPYVTGAGAAVNVGANYLLIPSFGMMGAAYATLLSYVVMAVGMYLASQRFYRVEYEWKKIVRMATITVVVMGVAGWMGLEPLTVTGLLLKLALAGSFLALVVITGVIDKHEIDETRAALAKKASSGDSSGGSGSAKPVVE
jgi:O-antigen/teichoic acid export membrane protein